MITYALILCDTAILILLGILDSDPNIKSVPFRVKVTIKDYRSLLLLLILSSNALAAAV